MAAIVKANTTLSTGGLVVLRRTFQTSNRGQVTYNAEYVCLAQFANTHALKFQSNATPPTPLPTSLLSLKLTRTPTLESLDADTENGFTYFRATYTAGVQSDLVFTTTSEQRNVSWRIQYGGVTRLFSFDYISISETVTGTNLEIPIVKGSTGRLFNLRGISEQQILQNQFGNITNKTIESIRTVRGRNGEYENSATSTGIYEAQDIFISLPQDDTPPASTVTTTTAPTPRAAGFRDNNKFDPTSLTGRSGKYSNPFSSYNIRLP